MQDAQILRVNRVPDHIGDEAEGTDGFVELHFHGPGDHGQFFAVEALKELVVGLEDVLAVDGGMGAGQDQQEGHQGPA